MALVTMTSHFRMVQWLVLKDVRMHPKAARLVALLGRVRGI